MRWESPGFSFVAVSGSSFTWSASGPISAISRRASSRAAGSGSGMSAMPLTSDEKYMPVPPQRIGKSASAISASAAPRHQAALAGSAAARTP